MKTIRLPLFLLGALLLTFSFNSCKKDRPFIPLFSISDDKELGMQVRDEIAADPTTYPLLNETQYASSYAYLKKIRDKILNSGQVYLKDKFDWEVRIVKDDNTLNAFCTPGGYIYVYTGLIKYLDSEEQLAGVLGHEIAHADRRHTSQSLQTQYGISLLLSVIGGSDSSTLKTIAANMYLLKNSRSHESDADEWSVKYLCPTDYQADGAADFFQKLIDGGNDCSTAFFSTHPCPDNRVANITAQKSSLGCSGNQTYSSEYATFKASLP